MQDFQFPYSPIQLTEEYPDKNIKVFTKRDDLIHPGFGGNKWRKLKYNIEAFRESDYKCIISFGGPFSNHIAALANICHEFKIPVIGIIRGEYSDPDNPTLKKAKEKGMILHHVPKKEYAIKEESPVIQDIISSYEHPFILPEGGSNKLAFKGVGEIQEELKQQAFHADIIFVAAGTGMTAAGIIENSTKDQKILVINIMRNEDMNNMIESNLSQPRPNWAVIDSYDFGGYAKVTPALIFFINQYYRDKEIRLDPVYNGKVAYAIQDLVSEGLIPENKTILHVHTGGLQGIEAYNYRCKKDIMKLI